jgi:hypothetical protein
MAETTTTLEHACKVIGTDVDGNQAIICTDLLEFNYGSTYETDGQTEGICENSSGTIVQCANITILPAAAWQSGITSYVSVPDVYECGHSYGNCPSGRYIQDGEPIPTSGAATCIANTWGVTAATWQGSVTAIELPESGTVITLSANYGTSHASVGNC